MDEQELKDIANKLRIHAIEMTNSSKSGHPTSCSSIAEIMAVLFFKCMKYRPSSPRDPSNDRLVLSKGHAAPILYAAWSEVGLFPQSELLKQRRIDNNLEGHPTPRLEFVDVATGSLGQGLSMACGMAYVGKYYDKADYRVYCIIGDGESAEGSVWEAMSFASFYKLDNLCAILDVNRLGQSEATMLGHDVCTYRMRLESFGWYTIVVDGHDVTELEKVFGEAQEVKNKPVAIVAKTYKGKDFGDIENAPGWHGKPLGKKADVVIEGLKQKIVNKNEIKLKPNAPTSNVSTLDISNIKLSAPPSYDFKTSIATRKAYGIALAKLAVNNSRVVALDGDTKNSTYSELAKEKRPEQFVECFIAEQNMVGVAIGMACRDRAIVFASTFATFFTRTFDQIRMGAISQTNVNFVGSHCGVSIGEDGPSQMGLEDIALFRAIPGSTIFYPSDAISTERAVELAANQKGICFIRTTRADTPAIYCNDAKFKIGVPLVIRKSDHDHVLVIGAGVTLFEALKAADKLQKEHSISIRIMDLFTVKPLDANTIVENAKECGNRIITVEDHYVQGGIGEAVVSAVSEVPNPPMVKKLAVKEVPRSGKPHELMKKFGINWENIMETVMELEKQKETESYIC